MKNLKNHHLCRFSYTDFQSILQPEDNGNQNPNESCTSKYQKDIAYSYSYELVCIDDKFSKPFSQTQAKVLFRILLIV